MAAVPEIVSVPTSGGTRELIDLAQPVLNWQKLETPQVSLLQCSQKYGTQGVRSLFDKLAERQRECTYEELNFSDNVIGDEGAACLADGLEGNKHLVRLLLPRTSIAAAGVRSLGKLVASVPNLQVLILSGNQCDAEGVTGAFADGLAKNSSLRSLCLADCRLFDAGAGALQAAATAHPTLEHLSLAYNYVSASVIPLLPLAPTGTLRFLDLSANSLGPDGAVALALALKTKKSKLEKLSVAQNMIKVKGAKALAEHFVSKEGEVLEFLDLRHNAVGYRGVKEIREMFGKTMEEENDGWLMLFGTRQLFLSGL